MSLLASGEIASKEWIYRQYDHMVRTDTTVLPGSDASVIRVKGTDKAIAMTVDCNSVYCLLDPRVGASIAVAEAARNLTVSGARPLALTDCLNFGNPERPEVMWQLKEAIAGIAEACTALEIPVIGGNVSLYNETSGRSIHPTPTIGMVGLIDDISQTTTQWFPGPSKFIYLISPIQTPGETPEHGLGGSVYLRVVHGLEKGPPPKLDLKAEKVLQKACLKAIKAGIIVSAHDVSEGGLAVAIAECCMHPERPIGAFIKLDAMSEGARPDSLLFGETQSRIIVTVEGDDEEKLKEQITSVGLSCEKIGVTGGTSLKIGKYIEIPAESLKKTWSGALESFITSGSPTF
jgi:phosphoribosylformylglycinamidine synthase